MGLALESGRTQADIEVINVNNGFWSPNLAAQFDPLPVVIDASGLGTTGYWAAGWLRTHRHIHAHLFDHRRIRAQITHADDDTSDRLLDALHGLTRHTVDLARHLKSTSPRPQTCASRRRAGPATSTSAPTPTFLLRRLQAGEKHKTFERRLARTARDTQPPV
ncbi:hypothetical protein ACIP5U_33850 [Streptomyces sp. NPDC088788]|uniref:hypothetical protein n=1 Tax=Streptomyces sp. NPDC088788 TaxID=3365898 RepID=UPI003819EBC0